MSDLTIAEPRQLSLRSRFPVTPGVLHYGRTGERRLPKKAKKAKPTAKVQVVKKLPAPAAAPAGKARVA